MSAVTELLIQSHHSGWKGGILTAAKCPQQTVVRYDIWQQAQLWHLVLKYVQCCLQAEGHCIFCACKHRIILKCRPQARISKIAAEQTI